MSEQELEAKMKQILDDYAPILNVTPPIEKISKPAAKTKQSKTKKLASSKNSRQGNKLTPHSVVVKL
jgi:hypothetical protein